MKTTDRLLHDVLHDDDYRAFREQARRELLAQVRRQTFVRRHSRLLALAACIPIAVGIALLRVPQPAQPSIGAAARDIVRTVPLEPAAYVVTRPADAGTPEIRPSDSLPPVVLVTVNTQTEIVRTRSSGVEWLNDEQLLALFPGRAVALVHLGSGKRQLLFPESVSTDGQP